MILPEGGEAVKAKVVKRVHEGEGIPVDKRNTNPIGGTKQCVKSNLQMNLLIFHCPLFTGRL
jgi:hypothetical protein